MLSVLLNQIWIGIGDILLKFFATFSSVLGLQVTVFIRVFSNLLRLFIVFVEMLISVSDQRNKSTTFIIMS